MGERDATTVLIVATEQETGEKLRHLLHGSGKPVLALETITDVATVPERIKSWKPHVLAVDVGLQLSPQDLKRLGVGVVRFDPLALDLEALAQQIVQRQGAAPEQTIPPAVLPRPATGAAVGFQGIKGGVGTTTVAAGMAVAPTKQRNRTANLKLDSAGGVAGDCALTLRAEMDGQDTHLFTTDAGILMVQGGVDLGQIWPILSRDYDVIVVDAGRVGEHIAETRALVRLGVLFFLVVTADEIPMLQPGSYPGYRLFLNREPERKWWQWDMAGAAPYDPEITARVNQGRFGTSSAFLLGMSEFTTRVVTREIV
jgi:hypothetical protein